MNETKETYMKNTLITILCIAVLQFVSCSNQIKNVNTSLISADDAKEIVAKEFSESDYYQKYYVVTSDKFDDRVYKISWGEPVLVRVIPDGKLYNEETYYYLLTGILPNGQVLVTQTVDAISGKLLLGSLLIGEEADVLKLASSSKCIEYCNKLGFDAKNAEAVFYYDGTINTSNIIYSWKYCLNTSTSRSLLDSDDISSFVFIDPWQNIEKSNGDSLSNTDAYFSKFSFNHRAYSMKFCGKIRSAVDSGAKFEAID